MGWDDLRGRRHFQVTPGMTGDGIASSRPVEMVSPVGFDRTQSRHVPSSTAFDWLRQRGVFLGRP
jgi:hypothetical protein